MIIVSNDRENEYHIRSYVIILCLIYGFVTKIYIFAFVTKMCERRVIINAFL